MRAGVWVKGVEGGGGDLISLSKTTPYSSATWSQLGFGKSISLWQFAQRECIRQKILPFSSSLFVLLVMYLFILVHIAPSLTWFMILRLETGVLGFFLFWNGLISSCSHTPYQRSQAVSNPQTARKKPPEDWSCELTIRWYLDHKWPLKSKNPESNRTHYPREPASLPGLSTFCKTTSWILSWAWKT